MFSIKAVIELEAGLLDANDHQPLVRHRVHKVLPVHLDRVYRISNAGERREQQRDSAQNLYVSVRTASFKHVATQLALTDNIVSN